MADGLERRLRGESLLWRDQWQRPIHAHADDPLQFALEADVRARLRRDDAFAGEGGFNPGAVASPSGVSQTMRQRDCGGKG